MWGRSKSRWAWRRPDVATEDGTERHPDGDDGERQVEVVLEGPGPRGIAAAVGHHHTEDGQHQEEQQWIGGRAGRGGQSQGPDPPGHGVQGPRDPSSAGQAPTVGAGSHGQPVRRRRQATSPPATASTATANAPIRKGSGRVRGRLGRPRAGAALTILGVAVLAAVACTAPADDCDRRVAGGSSPGRRRRRGRWTRAPVARRRRATRRPARRRGRLPAACRGRPRRRDEVAPVGGRVIGATDDGVGVRRRRRRGDGRGVHDPDGGCSYRVRRRGRSTVGVAPVLPPNTHPSTLPAVGCEVHRPRLAVGPGVLPGLGVPEGPVGVGRRGGGAGVVPGEAGDLADEGQPVAGDAGRVEPGVLQDVDGVGRQGGVADTVDVADPSARSRRRR